MVDGKTQTGLGSTNTPPHGTPLHFDDTDRVKVMDIDAKDVYSQTKAYRRTVVMIKVDDENSYGVDFFRILGGNEHIYSFHSQSDEIYETQGLNLVSQTDSKGNFIGTYAGESVPWGPDPNTDYSSWYVDNLKYSPGSTWLDNVRRDKSPGQNFAVDFKVKDFRSVLPIKQNLHLRMTVLNDFSLSEAAIACGKPPEKPGNPSSLEYVLLRRSGKNLDSLFTTVFEPYKEKRYLSSNMESVDVKIVEGKKNVYDTVKAVKINHEDGRIDYVVYATNQSVIYRVDDLFNFRGFIGVYTVKDGIPIYTYVNDGDQIGNSKGNIGAVTGSIKNFTQNLQMKNSITVIPEQSIDPAKLIGKYIYVDNDKVRNGAFKIEGASPGSNGEIVLDIGDVSLIRSYKDGADSSKGYIYDINKGQTFRIPLTSESDSSPVFETVPQKTCDTGTEIHVVVKAVSPIGNKLTFEAVTLPRGAQFNTQTNTFLWIPDSRQVGKNDVAIKATDGALSTTLHFTVQVYGATSGGGGIGGGVVINPPKVKDPIGGENEQPIEENPVKQDTQNNQFFTDLKGYDWAKDAINDLAAEGIIKGHDQTFAPGSSISRADFTILLVRSFKLTSDSKENFSDVSADKYYADDIAIAKENGIVTGVGVDKYNPTQNISRQDMMVIIVRAMEKAGYKLEEADESVLTQFTDASEISDYAKDAIAILIKNQIILGSDGKIKPRGSATRAEIAVLIKRILNKKA